MEIRSVGSRGDTCRQMDGNEANTRFSRLYGRVYKWSAKEMFGHACVSLFLISVEIFFRSIAQQFYCADTHSSLSLGQTNVNATRATPAKRVRSST